MNRSPIVIHPTTLGRLSCRLQYYWSREYRPLQKATHYDFGIAIHSALEDYYANGNDPALTFEKLWREHVPSISVGGKQVTHSGFGPEMELGKAMMRNYVKFYKGREDFQLFYTEKEIARRIPIPPDDPNPPARAKRFYVGARIDAVVFDRKLGHLFVLEHKTFETFYPKSLELDHQFVIEKFVAEGISAGPVVGVIYNGLRKRANETSTSKLFERHTLYITDQQVNVALHRAYWSLIMVTDPNFRVYPEPSTMKCNWCEFKDVCAEYCHGGDYKYMLETSFEKREDEDDSEWE